MTHIKEVHYVDIVTAANVGKPRKTCLLAEFYICQNGISIVVIIDGVCNNGFQFQTFINECAKTRITVIRFDYRGHGRSDDVPIGCEGLSLDECADDARRVLEYFYEKHGLGMKKSEKKVTVVCYSLGAQVALTFASDERNEDVVNGIAFVNGTFDPAFHGVFGIALGDFVAKSLKNSKVLFAIVVCWLQVHMFMLSLFPFLSSVIARFFVKCDSKSFRQFWKHCRRVQCKAYLSLALDAHANSKLEVIEWLESKRAVPMLCIFGTDDKLVNVSRSIETVKALAPSTEIETVRGGCHALLVHEKFKHKVALRLVNFCSNAAFDIDSKSLNLVLG